MHKNSWLGFIVVERTVKGSLLSFLALILICFSTVPSAASNDETGTALPLSGLRSGSFFENRPASQTVCPYDAYLGANGSTKSHKPKMVSPEEVLAVLGAFGPWNDMNKVLQKLPGAEIFDALSPMAFSITPSQYPDGTTFFPASTGKDSKNGLKNGIRAVARLGNAIVVVTGPRTADEGDTRWPYPIVRETAVLVEFENEMDRDAWADMAGHSFNKVYEPAEFGVHPWFQYVELHTKRPLAARKVEVVRGGKETSSAKTECAKRYGVIFILRRC